jgi:hypothetical protein
LVLPGGCQHLSREVGSEHERLQLQGGIQQPEHPECYLDAASGGSRPPVKALGRMRAAGEHGIVVGDRVGHERSSRLDPDLAATAPL